ncbi:hypothetical protein H9L39_19451 [Fusarium oxysporum f. sp. albedinis]|nr:hypothetical protein H9L39_19451 [Fusarium oxysporum f. sp. albedinis]
MVSFTSLIVTALTTSSAYALDCKQVGLVMEGYVGMGRSCQKTCADKAYYAVHAMANKGDPCIAGDGLSDVQGVQVTSEKPCTNPNCPALVECQCKFGFYAWRVRKENQGSVSCNNFDFAVRLARNTWAAPVGWSNTVNDVHCAAN